MNIRLWTTILSCALCMILLTVCQPSVRALPQLSPDVLIDVGHGGIDGGSFNGVWLEKDINLNIARLLEKSLNEHHIVTMRTRWSDSALSEDNHWLNSRSRHLRDLAQRKLIMEQLHPTIIVSLHCNWSPNSTRHGPVTLHQSNPQSIILANLVQHQLNSLYHTTRKSFYGKPFYILKHVSNPTVIVEMGFISNPSDLKMLTVESNQQKIVEAIRLAIWEYLLIFHINEVQEGS